ncbi:MAG: HAMP domain-containing histidine kinase [Deltaproteobacteria bacterium]|nr:HAMP domain-containing histidine kinase [Deltaproteobacteria bacterium]
MSAVAKLPGAEEIRRGEVERIIASLIWVRPKLLPAMFALVLAIVLLAPSRERFLGLGLILACGLVVIFIDRRRNRGGYRPEHVPWDIGIAAFLQTLIIATTGLVDSPFLVVWILLALLAALALGPTRFLIVLIASMSAGVWLMAFVELQGGVTSVLLRPPDPVELTRVVTRALVANGVLLAASFIGTRLHRAIRRMLDSAIDTRQQLLRTLADRNQELIGLSSAIAHELKNPLASIQGLVQLVERGEGNREKRFEVLHRELGRMKDSLEEFLNFSRPVGDLTRERLDAVELSVSLNARHEGIAARRSVRLVPLARGAAACTIDADRRKLDQALGNLLLNAIEASPEGGQVEWVLERSEGALQVGLQDRGPGLAPEVRARLGRIGVTTKPEGSGIGLTVARVIAEQHGGRLILEDRAGGGLSARLALPAPRAPDGEGARDG